MSTRRGRGGEPVHGLGFIALLGMAVDGLRSRRARAAMTAAGIAVGIGSIVAVIAISASSRAQVLGELDRLGTNLLVVEAKTSQVPGREVGLPTNSAGRLGRIGAVMGEAAMYRLDVPVTRNDLIPPGRNGGVTTSVADASLDDVLGATMHVGRFLDEGDLRLNRVVLGAVAAERLGVVQLDGRPAVVIDGHRFSVVGILDPLPLNPDIDRMALIGPETAQRVIGARDRPDAIYFRVEGPYVQTVAKLAARTVDPADPDSVAVSRPSEALEVQAAVDHALTSLLIGLGLVALLVGALGIANVMVIAVVERRTEIGVRRALGATRGHIAQQFVAESSMLATAGGVLGIIIGAIAAFGYASYRDWTTDLPVVGLAACAAGSLLVGALAGLYPALKASKLDPAEAVRARV